MKKPSMYSDRYGKARKRVRLRRNLGLAGAALVLFLLFFLPYLTGKLDEFRANGNQFPGRPAVTIPTGSTQAAATGEPATAATRPAVTAGPTPSTAAADRILSHELAGGGLAAIRYVQEGGSVRYVSVQAPGQNLHYDVSPRGGQLLILDPDDQSLTVYGQSLEGNGHSFDRYDNREQGIFLRGELAGKEGFIWMAEPRFLDEDIILYKSQLSRAMDDLYIWAHTIADKRHRLISGTRAEAAELLERTDAGYRIRLDERIVTITADLQVLQ